MPTSRTPLSVLVDSLRHELAKQTGVPPDSTTPGLFILGLDPDGNAQFIKLNATHEQLVELAASLPSGNNTIGKTDQGQPASNANAWPVKVPGQVHVLIDSDASGLALESTLEGVATESTLETLLSLLRAPTIPSITIVGQSTSTVTIDGPNVNRRGCIVFNDSTRSLYLKLGPAATVNAWSVRLLPGGVYELPFPIYTGLITGVWAADGAGLARITELT